MPSGILSVLASYHGLHTRCGVIKYDFSCRYLIYTDIAFYKIKQKKPTHTTVKFGDVKQDFFINYLNSCEALTGSLCYEDVCWDESEKVNFNQMCNKHVPIKVARLKSSQIPGLNGRCGKANALARSCPCKSCWNIKWHTVWPISTFQKLRYESYKRK